MTGWTLETGRAGVGSLVMTSSDRVREVRCVPRSAVLGTRGHQATIAVVFTAHLVLPMSASS